MSAHGTYGLPHTRVRDALRMTGSAILCTNLRGVERSSPPNHPIKLNESCFEAFECGKHKQPVRTALTLTSDSETMDRPACASDCGSRGATPIVVLSQRIVEPDEAFVRWTKSELERHAMWLLSLLKEHRRAFANAVKGEGLLAAMGSVPVTWKAIEAHAKEEERHHFLASPYQALHYAKARGFIWTEGDLRFNLENCKFSVLPSSADCEAAWDWIKRFPNILMDTQADGPLLVGNDRLSVLQQADTDILTRLVASKLSLPHVVVKLEVMPRLFLKMIENFHFNVCSRQNHHTGLYAGVQETALLLHLRSKLLPAVDVPDFFGKVWSAQLSANFYATETFLKFFLLEAERHAFISQALITSKQGSNEFLVGREAFPYFNREYPSATEQRVPDAFIRRFNSAIWMSMQ